MAYNIDRKAFFAAWRKDKKLCRLTKGRVAGLDTIIEFMEDDLHKFTIPQFAYILATTGHETGNTFLPIKEIMQGTRYKNAYQKRLRKRQLEYSPYFGRGYTQLTWLVNYLKLGKRLAAKYWELDKYNNDPRWLADNPDMALDPQIAWWIMTEGFKYGLFTGKKLSDYVKTKKVDFIGARRCINGVDKKVKISREASAILKVLEVSMTKVVLDVTAFDDIEKVVLDTTVPSKKKPSKGVGTKKPKLTLRSIYDAVLALAKRVLKLEGRKK